MTDDPLTYERAGVSLDGAESVVDRIRAAVISTHSREVLGGHGGFAGLFAPSVGDPRTGSRLAPNSWATRSCRQPATGPGRRCCSAAPPGAIAASGSTRSR